MVVVLLAVTVFVITVIAQEVIALQLSASDEQCPSPPNKGDAAEHTPGEQLALVLQAC